MRQFIYTSLLVFLLFSCLYIGNIYIGNIYVSELNEKQKIINIHNSPEISLNKVKESATDDTLVSNNDLLSNADVTNISDDDSTNADVMNSANDASTNDMDCIVSIPEINLEKIVYTGSEREDYLENYCLITATPDMKYVNGGNYIICGHASRLFGHSLNRLKEIKIGSKVYIIHSGIQDEYKVKSITYEQMSHTASYCEQTQEQELTIISCAKDVNENTYIVIKCSK